MTTKRTSGQAGLGGAQDLRGWPSSRVKKKIDRSEPGQREIRERRGKIGKTARKYRRNKHRRGIQIDDLPLTLARRTPRRLHCQVWRKLSVGYREGALWVTYVHRLIVFRQARTYSRELRGETNQRRRLSCAEHNSRWLHFHGSHLKIDDTHKTAKRAQENALLYLYVRLGTR